MHLISTNVLHACCDISIHYIMQSVEGNFEFKTYATMQIILIFKLSNATKSFLKDHFLTAKLVMYKRFTNLIDPLKLNYTFQTYAEKTK